MQFMMAWFAGVLEILFPGQRTNKTEGRQRDR